MSGKTMNTQSCSSAQLPWKTAVAMLRAGFTDVLSIGIVIRWISVSMSPTVRPVKPTVIEPRLVLAITKTNSAVNTISTRITTPRSKPPSTVPAVGDARSASGCRSRSTRTRWPRR